MITDVLTTEGPVRGFRADDGVYAAFLGIPFAAPPVGALRWKRPQPPFRHEGVLAADHFGKSPVQNGLKGTLMGKAHPELASDELPDNVSEDCLTLNILTPAESPDEKLPVMLWIYGGAFSMGSSSYFDGSVFCRNGCVFVSLNYRLNVFGFLAHPEMREDPDSVCGNIGILDQTAGLAWIHENIAAFGGDPENITLFGQSAGAMSIQLLSTYDQAAPYISRIILESGCRAEILTPWGADDPEKLAVGFMEYLGAENLEQMRAIDTKTLYNAWFDYTDALFGPVVDGKEIRESSFEAIRGDRVKHIPVLLGYNANDARTAEEPGLTDEERASRYKEIAVRILGPEAAEEYLKLADGKQLPFDVLSFLGVAARAISRVRQRNGQGPTFRYYFTRPAPEKEGVTYHPFNRGAHHSAEIPYVFDVLRKSDRPYTEEDQKLSDQIVRYWVNFARTGDPNGEGLPEWEAYREEKPDAFMQLDLACGMQDFPVTSAEAFLVDAACREV